MDTLVKDGGFVPGPGGLPAVAVGLEETLNYVRLSLAVRQGEFPYDRSMGSRLHLLGREPERMRQNVAEVYVREALASEDGLEVIQVNLSEPEAGRLDLSVDLLWKGLPVSASLSLP